MERLGIVPVINSTVAAQKAAITPSDATFAQVFVDSGNANKLSWINSAGTVVVIATV